MMAENIEILKSISEFQNIVISRQASKHLKAPYLINLFSEHKTLVIWFS